MADKIHLGSDIIQFTVVPTGVSPPPIEVNWLLILATLLAGAGATYAATA